MGETLTGNGVIFKTDMWESDNNFKKIREIKKKELTDTYISDIQKQFNSSSDIINNSKLYYIKTFMELNTINKDVLIEKIIKDNLIEKFNNIKVNIKPNLTHIEIMEENEILYLMITILNVGDTSIIDKLKSLLPKK